MPRAKRQEWVVVGERVRAARDSVGLPRRVLASAVEVGGGKPFGPQVLGLVETGYRRLSGHEAVLVAEACNTTPDYLLTGEGELQGGAPNLSPRGAGDELAREVLAQLAALRAEVQSLSATIERLSGVVATSAPDRATDQPRSQRPA